MKVALTQYTAKQIVASILLLLSIASPLTVCAQASTADTVSSADTVYNIKNLDEIVVTARNMIVSAGKSSYYPSKELKATTNNGIQLMAALQIPELIVNPASGSITLAGRNNLSIRINGHQATETDLLSISSKDITRVEYISNPGARYGDVDAVLDITVKRRETGYGMILNILQSPNRGWGNYTGNLKFNTGRSEWSLDYNSNPMWKMDCYRDNTEHILLPDGSAIDRTESGIKTPNRMVTHRLSLQYSYAVGNSLLLNIQARVSRKNDKYVSKGNILTESDGIESSGYESETMPIKNWQGDLDIYMHYRINRRNKVFLNIIPTVTDGTNHRIYETPGLKIESNIINRGYHFLLEGIWEGDVGKGKLSAGIRSKSGWIKSTYLTTNQNIRENDSDNRLFAEWRQSIDKVEYSIGVEGSLYTVRKPVSYTKIFASPRLSLRYTPFSWGGVNITLNTSTVAPTVNQINPCLQQVDRYLWTTGNPVLRPFHKFEQKIEFDFNYNEFFAGISVADRYCHNPIMDAKSYAESGILESYHNSGYNNDLEVRGFVKMPLFIRQLTLSITGGWHKTVSKGVGYIHSYSQPFVNAQLMFMTGGWWIMARYNNSYNQLWGEMISSVNQNLLNFGVGYTYRKATFSVGIVNPFGNVSIRTKLLGYLYSYDRTYCASGSHRLVWLGITLNLHKGKKRSATKKRLDNTTIYESIKNSEK